MNVQAKVDWIGTPKPYIYKDEVTYNATSIDFSLAGDDNRYKLIVLKSENNTHYQIVQYGIKPGSQKPFPIDILLGSDSAAQKWGRKTVKVKILK